MAISKSIIWISMELQLCGSDGHEDNWIVVLGGIMMALQAALKYAKVELNLFFLNLNASQLK